MTNAPVNQRHADMCMWQAFIMANGDPNCGDLQDAWDALGEEAMQFKAMVLSSSVQVLWNAGTNHAMSLSDACAEYLRLCKWGDASNGFAVVEPTIDTLIHGETSCLLIP